MYSMYMRPLCLMYRKSFYWEGKEVGMVIAKSQQRLHLCEQWQQILMVTMI